MNGLGSEPVSSSVMAFVATLHVALLVLRKHRSAGRKGLALLLAPSAAFTVFAWILSTPIALGAGLIAHLAWFLACERLLPPLSPRRAAIPTPAPAPIPAAMPAARPAAPAGFVPVPVLAVLDETDDIRTFRLARPDGFDFQAGQFLTVRVQVDGKPLARCYSISSGPEATGYLEISVKRQGLVSSTLHSVVRPGALLSIRAPAGPFVYPAGDDRPLVLLAGGVGITPLMSMLRHAVAADPGRPVTLLLSVKTPRDIPFRDELSCLSRRHPQARVVVAVTRGASESLGVYPGRIDEALIRQTVADPVHAVYAICGPLPMIAGMKELLARLQVPADHVRAEAFEAAVKGSTAPVADAPVAPIRAGRAAGPTCAVEAYTLQLARSRRQAAIAVGQSLLEAAEAAGAEIPNQCRAGVCQTCVTRLVTGEVACDADDVEPGYVLPCVARAKSHVTLDA